MILLRLFLLATSVLLASVAASAQTDPDPLRWRCPSGEECHVYTSKDVPTWREAIDQDRETEYPSWREPDSSTGIDFAEVAFNLPFQIRLVQGVGPATSEGWYGLPVQKPDPPPATVRSGGSLMPTFQDPMPSQPESWRVLPIQAIPGDCFRMVGGQMVPCPEEARGQLSDDELQKIDEKLERLEKENAALRDLSTKQDAELAASRTALAAGDRQHAADERLVETLERQLKLEQERGESLEASLAAERSYSGDLRDALEKKSRGGKLALISLGIALRPLIP